MISPSSSQEVNLADIIFSHSVGHLIRSFVHTSFCRSFVKLRDLSSFGRSRLVSLNDQFHFGELV